MGQYQLPRMLSRSAPVANLIHDDSLDSEHVAEHIYRNHIPEFVAATLIRLYDNVYCTLRRIEAFDSLTGISTYVRRIDSQIHTVILFRDQGREILAVNQQIELQKDQIEQFAKKVFEEYKRAQTISFYAIDLAPCQFIFPSQFLASLEENVIFFPPKADDYSKTLKGQFRKQLRVSNEQLLADHPGYRLTHYSKNEIDQESVKAILDVAKQRMRAKGKADYTRDIDVAVLTGMLRNCGHMTVAYIDDRICGGAMWFSVGKRHFHQLAAYDPAYGRYMLGNQIWLAAILHSLHLGGSECWLMGGASAHKARFGARKKVLNSFTVYRSTWHIGLNIDRYISIWLRQNTGRGKAALKKLSTRSTGAGRAVGRVLLIASAIKSVVHQATSD